LSLSGEVLRLSTHFSQWLNEVHIVPPAWAFPCLRSPQ